MSAIDFSIPNPADKSLGDFVGPEQSQAKVERVLAKIQPLLTATEKVQHVVVQTWKAFKLYPSALVLTNRRVIYVDDGLMRMSFHDLLWRNLADTHLRETPMGGVLQFKSLGGLGFYVDKLPKEMTRHAYAYGQAAEELAFDFRRQRQMEESRASAQGLIAAPGYALPAIAPTAPEGVGKSAADALLELQGLHARGLISDIEYQQKKDEVLARL